jgi:hypothetical protein
MISMKHFAPSGIIVLLALTGPADAKNDPATCAEPPDLVDALETSASLSLGGCPKVLIHSIRGVAGTACVFHFSDDWVEEADTPAPNAIGTDRSLGATLQTFLSN